MSRFPQRVLHGFINVDKPSGLSSADVVNRVKWACRRVVRESRVKIGHCGTLDPLATGVLVLCLGHASRLQDLLHEQPKSYRGRFQLGLSTNTEDITGEVLRETTVDPDSIPRAAIEQLLPQFTGKISQVPPRYSAVFVDGRRAYKRAQRGHDFEMEARDAEVHKLSLADYEFPFFDLNVNCAAGTYIRSLGRDIGERLGCGATMTQLVRESVGPFRITEAVDLNLISERTVQSMIQPAAAAVVDLPIVQVTGRHAQLASGGNAVPLAAATIIKGEIADSARVGLLGSDGELLAIATLRPEREDIKPLIVLRT